MTAAPSAGSDDGPDVVVVGSLNLDVVVRAPHHPRPGETVLGHDHFENPGGKGANQAVAAARLGAHVAMVGRVGDDPAGAQLRTSLQANGVDLRALMTTRDVVTGAAFITVSDVGENTIVVSPGANAVLSAGDIGDHARLLETATVCLVQLEVSEEVVAAAVELAGGTVVVNPAPARELPDELLERVDVLVPNEGELAQLAGVDEVPGSLEALACLARSLPTPRVVVTLGGRGAVVVDGAVVTEVAAPTVEVVDTTAAGDTFCGALAEAMVRGWDLVEATRWAVAAGACTVQASGAQRSMPTREEVQELADAT